MNHCYCGNLAIGRDGAGFVCATCKQIEARNANQFHVMSEEDRIKAAARHSADQWSRLRPSAPEPQPGPLGILIRGHGVYAI